MWGPSLDGVCSSDSTLTLGDFFGIEQAGPTKDSSLAPEPDSLELAERNLQPADLAGSGATFSVLPSDTFPGSSGDFPPYIGEKLFSVT